MPGGPPRSGPGCWLTASARRGQRLVALHAIPRCHAEKRGGLAPWGLRRSDACGRGTGAGAAGAGNVPPGGSPKTQKDRGQRFSRSPVLLYPLPVLLVSVVFCTSLSLTSTRPGFYTILLRPWRPQCRWLPPGGGSPPACRSGRSPVWESRRGGSRYLRRSDSGRMPLGRPPPFGPCRRW